MTGARGADGPAGGRHGQAARAAETLWQMWHRSGDPRLDGLLGEGIDADERQDLPAADAAFTRLVEERPPSRKVEQARDLRYISKDYEAAIADCRKRSRESQPLRRALRPRDSGHLMLGQFARPPSSSVGPSPCIPIWQRAGDLRTAISEMVKLN